MSLFLENLMADSSISLSPSSFTSMGATTTSSVGWNLMDAENEGLQTLGCLATSSATSLTLNGENVYEKTLQQLEITQAYVESLNQQELEELICQLEAKETELTVDKDYARELKKF